MALEASSDPYELGARRALLAARTLGSDMMKPDPVMAVSDWSDKYRVLSQVTSAEPGRWRTERTPYLREIMDALSANSPYREVVFMKGSQIGGSEAGLNWLAYIVDQYPGPAMLVQPTDILAKRFSKQRLDYMFRETPKLRGKLREKKSRDSTNTAIFKEYDGGLMVISGANSAPGLRSMPIKLLFLDEVDAYPMDVGGEGDPVALAEARARTFPRRKVFKVSTPNFDNRSRIAAAYNASDMRVYKVPCPFCEHFQEIKWDRIKWDPKDFNSAHMVCEKCERKIGESNKTKMLAAGRWEAQNQNAEKHIAGFHLSALYSPLGWYSWAQAAYEWTEAKKSELKLRVFVNTVLGETWKVRGDAPEWRILFDRRERYPFNVVPKGGLFLTCGVDVQRDRLELEIVAWGSDKQSWSIDYRVLHGDTSQESVYKKLDSVLNETFQVEGTEVRLPLRLMAVDSGFNTQAVYNYARNRPLKVIAVKGFDNMHSIVGLPTPQEVSYQGRKIAKGVKLWPVGSSSIKSEFYGWLRLNPPTNENETFPAGYCHFPEHSDDYFQMLTAEQLSSKIIKGKGFRKYYWEKIRERNEALDARIYARAAAAIVGLDRWTEKDFNEMREALRSVKRGPVEKPNREKGGIPVKPSDYWGDR